MATNLIVDDFVQGDTPTWGITVYQDTAKTTLQDTTGYQAWVTFKSDTSVADGSAELQVTATMNSADGLNGLIAVRPTISESASLPAGTYNYDFQIKDDTASIIWTPEVGTVRVQQAVTLSSS